MSFKAINFAFPHNCFKTKKVRAFKMILEAIQHQNLPIYLVAQTFLSLMGESKRHGIVKRRTVMRQHDLKN